MKRKMLMAVGVVLLAIFAGAGGVIWYIAAGGKPKAVPDKIDALGPFEIVTHTVHYRTGWNTGKLGWGKDEYYSLRYRGKPVTIHAGTGTPGDDRQHDYSSFNSIVTFPSPEPAVVVNLGDPNNTSFYYLLRDGGAVPKVGNLGDSSGEVSATWLDPSPEAATSQTDTTIRRVHRVGGRYLLFGGYAVVDTKTLQHYLCPRSDKVSLNQFKPPITLSPDGRSFVRFGYDILNGSDPMLAVFNFITGKNESLPIDRKRARFNRWEDIDVAWLNYYFEWKDGHLAARPHVTPLPYRGDRQTEAYDPNQKSYSLKPVHRELYPEFVDFIEHEYHAAREPKTLEDHDTLVIGDKKVHVLVQSYDRDFSVGIWMDRGTGQSLVFEIGDRFDAALKTGRYDKYFLP